jgi:hypothetical protein
MGRKEKKKERKERGGAQQVNTTLLALTHVHSEDTMHLSRAAGILVDEQSL